MTIDLALMSNALPEMFVLTVAAVSILFELFVSPRCKNVTYLTVQFGVIGAAIMLVFQLGVYRSVSFGGLFVADDVAVLLKLFILACVYFSFCYSRQYVQDKNMPTGEYYILGLFSTLGMMILVSAHSLLTIYLGLELMSLPLYALIALRRESGTATEAAMKYFVMGAIASGILLYGMSVLYGAVGSLDLSVIADRMTQVWQTTPMMLSFAVVFLVVGVCFKLAAVPFHMWAPDVYHGAPSAVTILISSAPKLAAAGMMFRIFAFGLPAIAAQWQPLFTMVALLSVVVGNLFAVVQTNIKRLFAYSAIAHMGYMLFGLIAATPEGFAASLYYILIYGLMAVAGFGLIIMMSRLGLDAEMIDDLKGLNARSPWLAAMMLITLFSMAGVPPMVGFFTKFMVLKALVASGFMKLAFIGLVAAVIGAYNYIRIVKTMYFETPVLSSSLVITTSVKAVFSVNALCLLAFGLAPNAIVQACIQAFNASN